MKKTVLILFVFIGFIVISCKQNAANKVNDANLSKSKEAIAKSRAGLPEMTFESKSFDFGTINEGDEIDAVYKFTNTGKSDLIITRAKASCGCTVPDWPRNKAIKPGESSEIKAHFRSRGKRNKQHKSITLTTNTATGKDVIYITGFVTPDPNRPKPKPRKLPNDIPKSLIKEMTLKRN